MKDFFIQVDKFIYHVDFIILETEPVVNNYKPIPVILDRLFLATANTLINYMNGIMNLSFGNMTLELNIFNMCKQPYDDDNEDESMELIEPIMEEHFQGSLPDPMEICVTNSLESNVHLDPDISNDFSLLDFTQVPDDGKKHTFEELGTLEEEKKEEVPKLELKTLSEGLKYAFLEDEQTYPAVISSSLTSDQKDNVLKKCKKRIRWTLKGMKDTNCKNRLHLTGNARTYRQSLKRFKCVRKKLVKTEVLKYLDHFISYIPGLETSTFVRKCGTKQLGACHKFTRWK